MDLTSFAFAAKVAHVVDCCKLVPAGQEHCGPLTLEHLGWVTESAAVVVKIRFKGVTKLAPLMLTCFKQDE